MKNVAIGGALLVALVLVQHCGLERTAEKKIEDKYTKVTELPASSVLPSYIASLFLGSLRAVVVDALWIEMRKMRDEEHRYFETRELMSFIAVLQPRNPEIWVQQAQDAGWNIANPMRDKTKKWAWIKIAFETLDKGIKQLPDNAYIKFEVARTLFQKPTIRDGAYDEWYLEQVEKDDALQALLQGDPKWTVRKTAFELAIPFLQRAADDVRAMKERNGFKYWTSQTGYNLSLSTLEGYQRICMMHQAQVLWRRGKPAEAAVWFRRAAQRGREVFDEHSMPIYRDYAKLDDACAEVAEMDARLPVRDPLAVLNALSTKVLPWSRGIDFEYVRTMAGAARAALGGDGFEWNDNSVYATDLPYQRGYEANLAGGEDQDWYLMGVPDVAGGFGLRGLTVGIINLGEGPVVVTFHTMTKEGLTEMQRDEIAPGMEKTVPLVADHPGLYFVAIRSAKPVAPGTRTTYRVAWVGFGDEAMKDK